MSDITIHNDRAAAKIREDGWYNAFSQLGARGNSSIQTTFLMNRLLDKVTLGSLFRSNGLAKKIVTLPANEMTREWINIEGDTDGEIVKYFENIKLKKAIKELLVIGRLYGGAVLVLGIQDGGMLDEPLRMNTVKSIDFMRVYDRHQVTWNHFDINSDPNSFNYGNPEYFTITPINIAPAMSGGGTGFRVHQSRVIRYNGAFLPERESQSQDGWGDSVLQGVFNELRDLGSISGATVSIIEDFVQTILQIDNLADMIASGQESIVKARMDILDMSRSTFNTIFLDSDEQYTKQSSSVSGLDGLFDKFSTLLSAVTGIPITKLFGQSPAGMNATGESDVRNFYDTIKTNQEDDLLPILERVMEITLAMKDFAKLKGKDEFSIEFNPLWQLSDVEDSQWKKNIAETDKIYIESSVLSPTEVAKSRFENGFNPDTKIDFNNREFETPDVDDETLEVLKPNAKPEA